MKICMQQYMYVYVCSLKPHQRPKGSTLKIGRQEVLCSILGRTCRPSLSGFFVNLSETLVNTSQDSLEHPPPLWSAYHLLSKAPRIGKMTYTQTPTQV